MTEEEQKAAEAIAAAEAAKAAAGKSGDGAADQKGDAVPLRALTEERGKRQALEARLKAIEATFQDEIAYDAVGNVIRRPAQQQQQQYVDPNQQQHNNYAEQLNRLWEEDPRKAMTTELVNTIAWYDGLQNSIEDQFEALATKVKDVEQYRPHIRNYIRRLPMDQRSRPGIVEAAYYLQKGQGFDELLAQEQKRIQERLQAGESIQGIAGGYSDTGGGSQKVTYTEDQRKVAALYGQTPEEYWKGAKS